MIAATVGSVASDIADYVAWTRDHVAAHGGFAEEGDPPVPETDQVIRDQSAPGRVVGGDARDVDVGHLLVEQHGHSERKHDDARRDSEREQGCLQQAAAETGDISQCNGGIKGVGKGLFDKNGDALFKERSRHIQMRGRGNGNHHTIHHAE